MARKSTSSSAPSSNGQKVAPGDGDTSRSSKASLTSSPLDHDDPKYDFDQYEPTESARSQPMPYDSSLLPRGSRSLTAIGEQAFFLGFVSATSLLSLVWLTVHHPHPLWRLPAFLVCLSVFHFMEYETTARFNLPAARASSFLLFTNGAAYNVAYALAVIEIVVSCLYPPYQAFLVSEYTVWSGVGLIVAGQLARSVAMIQAGTNFNHTPATKKQDDHQLVTRGIYGWLRHPSYFGFFWWAVGTQLLVGNKLCLPGYIIVLWGFFHHRIIAEEKKLVEFFGTEYEAFRERTPTGIPFIR